jgi:hypothetical protein
LVPQTSDWLAVAGQLLLLLLLLLPAELNYEGQDGMATHSVRLGQCMARQTDGSVGAVDCATLFTAPTTAGLDWILLFLCAL